MEQYYSEIMNLGHRLSKRDFDSMTKFIDGLPNKLKFHMRAGNQATAEAAFTSSKEGEAYDYRITKLQQLINCKTEMISISLIHVCRNFLNKLNK